MLTLEAAQKSSDWVFLTVKQKAFITAYLTNGGDATAAVLASFNVQAKNAASYANQLLARHRVQLVLGLTRRGKMSKKEFLELTAQQMRMDQGSTAFYKLADMYRAVAGWTRKKDDDSVDDLVKKIEKRM